MRLANPLAFLANSLDADAALGVLRPPVRAARAKLEAARTRVWRALLFDRRRYARRRNRRHVIAVGDSHLKVFSQVRRAIADIASIDVVMVDGATALGLVNPNSQTDALGIFSRRLKTAKPWQTLCCHLGEVDCGFVIWYRAEKFGVSIPEQLELSLHNYLEFIESARHRLADVWVLSVSLPTIEDGAVFGPVAQKRAEVSTTLRQRTELTLEYNARLQAECATRELKFINLTEVLLDGRTGLVRRQLVTDDAADPHLDSRAFAPIVSREIRKVIAGTSGSAP